MRVLFITGYMYEKGLFEEYNGGINLYVSWLAKKIAKTEDVEVYALTYGINKEQECEKVKYLRHSYMDVITSVFHPNILKDNHNQFGYGVSIKALYHKADYKYFDRVINELHPDVVHIHGMISGLMQHIESCKKSGASVLVTLHGLLGTNSDCKVEELKRLENWMFGYADKNRMPLTVISTGIKQKAISFYNLSDASNISVIYNGVDIDNSSLSVNVKNDKQIVVCIGRIYRLKNQVLVFKAMERIFEKYPDRYKLIFIGEETDEGQLREIINESNYKKNVEITCFISHERVMNIQYARDSIVL